MAEEPWKEISEKAKEILFASIPVEWRISQDKLPGPERLDVTKFPEECGLLTQAELAITGSYATEIVEKVAKGEWKAEDVTVAFCKRAAIAHQVTNCLTVIMFEEGIAQARKLDEHFAKTGKVVGPLHGLPISLKDNFNVRGKPSSVGFTSLALEPMQEESTLVGILRGLGAVQYVKTNVPTAMMIPETVNNCYGRTVNALNRNLTPGGSSGGETALIQMRGSVLGIGTDIGGSLRIPAACTGLVTIRPSFGRFPNFDARSGLAGQEAIGSVHGPLARNVADLRLYTENMSNSEPWLKDPKCLPLSWRSVEIKSRPKIAILRNNGLVTPTPPVQRALKVVEEKLSSSGYDIVEWPGDSYAEASALVIKFFIADGAKSIRKLLEPTKEPFRAEMQRYADAKDMDVYDLWQAHKERTALQKVFLDRWAAIEGLDAILSPTTPYAAPKNGDFKSVSYTSIFNLLDYSSTSFPTGLHADKKIDLYPPDFKPQGEQDEITRNDYDAEGVHGMPISLQLTCRRLEEEKAMALTEKVIADLAA